MKSDRSFGAYVAWFSGTALALFFTAVGLSLFFGPLSGDLTRIGKWAERDFAPGRPQALPPVRGNGPQLTSQQVLVLGDSFSHPNVWQSYLVEAGKLETLSFQFRDVGCIDNWVNWVNAKAEGGSRTVVIQVAERSFVSVFKNIKPCVFSVPVASETPGKTSPGKLMSGITLDVVYLFQTAANSLRLRWQSGRANSGGVANVPLSTASLFSNARANRLLYYAEDDNKKSWTRQDIDTAIVNLRKIRGQLKASNLLFVVVPDKSTVYRPYMLDEADKAGHPDIFAAMKSSGIESVDLLTLFRQNVTGTVDLYLPNDTHLGPSGYRLMGGLVADSIQPRPEAVRK